MNTKARRLAALLLSASLAACAAAQEGWHNLFDGETLEGWTPNERPESWAVEDGAIVTRGDRSHLFYTGPVADHDFKNFELSVEAMTEPGSNSGIYIHTKFQPDGWPAAGYECQVVNSAPAPAQSGGYTERKMTGSIYAIRNAWKSPARDGEWFDYRIVVRGKTIETYVDGQLVCAYTEPEDAYRPSDKPGRLLGSGTFALQAHDPGSVVRYRAIRVRILPEDTPTPGAPLADAELDRLVTQLSNDNFPLVDFGIAAPSSDDAAAELLEGARTLGATVGIQTSDTGTPRALPAALVFHGWRAPDGLRFSKSEQFPDQALDFVIVPYSFEQDAVGSAVAVARFVGKVAVDLVEVEIPDTLGAEARAAFRRLLASLADSDAALLVNDRAGPPSAALLREAKAAGVELAFSSGGAERLDPERFKRRLEAILDAGLSWSDLWVPETPR